MKVHLVDGTYELFRHFFGAPPHRTAAGEEVAAVRGVVSSVLQLLGEGATHVGVATDHVIESFRNDLWPGYKTGEGVDPDLWSQAWPLEAALSALGVVVWPMVEVEADDALASGAAVAADDPAVEQVIICTRTSASVCAVPASCSSTGGRTP
jgi:5'-3' exonuclease